MEVMSVNVMITIMTVVLQFAGRAIINGKLAH